MSSARLRYSIFSASSPAVRERKWRKRTAADTGSGSRKRGRSVPTPSRSPAAASLSPVVNLGVATGSPAVGKAALNAIGPLTTALLRFLVASLALLTVHFLRPRRQRIAREDIPKILWVGFLVVPVNQGFFLFGLSESTASHASLLYALTPHVVLLLARRFLSEAHHGSQLIGLGSALI